ncbi:MAG TPA: methyltransferase type 11, partial [Caulobacteraceae bacterium]
MKHLQRLTVVALGGAAALFAAGCDGSNSVRIASTNDTTDGALRQIETLQCPQEVGPLVRRGAAADGLSCTYAGPRGAEVTLRLVSLAEGQTLAQALSPLEQELRVLMPQAVARASQPDAAQAAALRAAGAQVDAAERVAQEAARTGDEAARAAQGAGESVDV